MYKCHVDMFIVLDTLADHLFFVFTDEGDCMVTETFGTQLIG